MRCSTGLKAIDSKMFVPFVALSFLANTFAFAQNVTIYGPEEARSIFQDLTTTCLLTRTETVNFAVAGSSTTSSYLAAGHPIVVTKLINVSNTSLTIPMFGVPLVIVYNVPQKGTGLNLTQQVFLDIFLGRITRWNDSNLTLLNPMAELPDRPITLVVGSLLELFVEGMSVLAGKPVNISSSALYEGSKVCARVKSTQNSIGLSWMGDALATAVKLASLQNKEGLFSTAARGSSSALSEYYFAKKNSSSALPYNMPGRLTWPLMGLFYIVLPQQFSSCSQLQLVQDFLATVMFRTANTDLMVQVEGWQPAKALSLLDLPLGLIEQQVNYREQLFRIPCGQLDTGSAHTVAATGEMWPAMLKLLAAYSGQHDNSLVLSPSSNITDLLLAMLEQKRDVDLTLTWEYVIDPYKELYSVPVFMGAVVPFINFAGQQPPILSVALLADIFLANITQWNDPRIQELNPGVVLPAQRISVFAAPSLTPDGRTAYFIQLLRRAKPGFNWADVNQTVSAGRDLMLFLEFTNYSIAYGFSTLVEDAFRQVPRLIGFDDKPIFLSSESLAACWISRTYPSCWPMAIPLSVALRHPGGNLTCEHQKRAVSFAGWMLDRKIGVHPYLVPNLGPQSLGDAEFCNGRSLLVTNPEPQVLSSSAKNVVYVLTSIGLCWTVCQAIALALARKQSELKSASVVFSFVAIVGAFLILVAPLLIVQDHPSSASCGSAMWLLVIGFSGCFGALFSKLFRLYTIFTSRKLVVPRLSNRRLLLIVLAFLTVDFLLLLIYSLVTPPGPEKFSVRILSPEDLVTGYREFTLDMCSFHVDSPVLYVILVIKFLVAVGGAGMAFFIRQVDRRFSAATALGLAFYNMFLTVGLAVVIVVFLQTSDNLEFPLFTPIFCGLWIMFVTLIALTLDSNVLMACRNFSKPLRKVLTGTNDSMLKDNSVKTSKGYGTETPAPEGDSKVGPVFVVNRDMFPSAYDKLEEKLLEKILEELNFQRDAVRRALVPGSSVTPSPRGGPAYDYCSEMPVAKAQTPTATL